MALHKNVVEGDIHIVNNYTFADEAAMNVVTGLYANTDIGKIALVEADNSLWMLIATVPTWVPVTGSFPGQLDGYLLTSDFNTAFSGLTVTELEHYNQISAAITHLRDSADGYDSRLDAAESTISTHTSQISGLDLTVEQHKAAQYQVNQSIIQALDGYLTAVGFVEELTFTENKNAQEQVNQSILQSLDGYLTTIGDYTLEITFQQNKAAQGEINSLILQALDAYGSTAGLVSEVTFQENKSYFNGAIEDIINALDGYSAPPGGVSETTFNENKNAQEQINQSILQSLDGYLTQVVGFVEELTFTENKNAQGQINQSILQALDGYGGGGGVSELTFTENKNAQGQINQSILQALDGYDSSTLDGYIILNSTYNSIVVDNDGYILANRAIHTCMGPAYVPVTYVIIDWSLANSFTLDLNACTGNCSVDMSGAKAGGSYLLAVLNHATSAKTVTWGGNILFSGGSPTAVTATAGARDLVSIFFDGTYFYASLIGDFKRTS